MANGLEEVLINGFVMEYTGQFSRDVRARESLRCVFNKLLERFYHFLNYSLGVDFFTHGRYFGKEYQKMHS